METSVKLAGPHVSTSVEYGVIIPHIVGSPPMYISVYVTNPVAFVVNVRLTLLPRLRLSRAATRPTAATYA